jgi:hypothetical protein
VFQVLKIITVPQAVLQIRDVYPGPRILTFIHPESRIPDPTTRTKKIKEKKNIVAKNITKSKIVLFFE